MFAANILFLHINYIAEQNCKLPIFDINGLIPRIDIGKADKTI